MERVESISKQSQRATRLCIAFPRFWRQPAKSAAIRLADLIQLIEPSAEKILVMTSRDVAQELGFGKLPYGEKVQFAGNVECSESKHALPRILGELSAQLQICRNIMSMSDSVNIIFWRARPATIIMPLVLAKLRGKRSILFRESIRFKVVRKMHKGPFNIGGLALFPIYRVIEEVAYSLSDRIAMNVPSLLNDSWTNKYRSKLFPYPIAARFISPEFKISKPLDQRRALVGYIGLMRPDKGVLNLVKAIPLICNQMKEVEVFLGGGGPLLRQVEGELGDLISRGKVRVFDWIPHNELPDYLNQMKLLVLPSDIEGLPSIVLEAMACGTPVLATPVGAIPDIITDGKTGFIMDNNSPECIAENVIRALGHHNLDQVSQNAHAFVEGQFSHETLVERYRDILTSLNLKR
jgi:glycosyltransferase involved in cell wall biosynthesis